MRWDGGRVHLIASMNYAPTTSCLTHKKGWAAVRRLALTYMPRLGSLVEELVDVFDLLPRQWPLTGHTILGARFQANLVPDTSMAGRRFSTYVGNTPRCFHRTS